MTTWSACGFPILILIFTIPYVVGSGGSTGSLFFGKSQSLLCAPPAGDGFTVPTNAYHYRSGDVVDTLSATLNDEYQSGVGANGFTETYYMSNYCWENMQHYPAKTINIITNWDDNGIIRNRTTPIQVHDSEQDIQDFRMIKYFPYFLVFHSILLLWPSILWSKLAAPDVRQKIKFLVGGIEEGLNCIVGSLGTDKLV